MIQNIKKCFRKHDAKIKIYKFKFFQVLIEHNFR